MNFEFFELKTESQRDSMSVWCSLWHASLRICYEWTYRSLYWEWLCRPTQTIRLEWQTWVETFSCILECCALSLLNFKFPVWATVWMVGVRTRTAARWLLLGLFRHDVARWYNGRMVWSALDNWRRTRAKCILDRINTICRWHIILGCLFDANHHWFARRKRPLDFRWQWWIKQLIGFLLSFSRSSQGVFFPGLHNLVSSSLLINRSPIVPVPNDSFNRLPNGLRQTKKVNSCRRCLVVLWERWSHCHWLDILWKASAGIGHSMCVQSSHFWLRLRGSFWWPILQPNIRVLPLRNVRISKNRLVTRCRRRKPFRRIGNCWHRCRFWRWCFCTMEICGACSSWWRVHRNDRLSLLVNTS